MKRLVATDFDGTIHNGNGISREDISMIRKLANEPDTEVVIISGRPTYSLRGKTTPQLGDLLDRDVHLAGFNGGVSEYNGAVMESTPIDEVHERHLIEKLIGTSRNALVHQGDGAYFLKREDITELFQRISGYSFNPRRVEGHIFMVEALLNEGETIEDFKKSVGVDPRVLEELTSYVFPIRMGNFPIESQFVQFAPRVSNKENSLLKYIETTQAQEVIVFGDGINDIEMLSIPGITAVAMGNMDDEHYETLPPWTHRTLSVDESGFSHYFK